MSVDLTRFQVRLRKYSRMLDRISGAARPQTKGIAASHVRRITAWPGTCGVADSVHLVSVSKKARASLFLLLVQLTFPTADSRPRQRTL